MSQRFVLSSPCIAHGENAKNKNNGRERKKTNQIGREEERKYDFFLYRKRTDTFKETQNKK